MAWIHRRRWLRYLQAVLFHSGTEWRSIEPTWVAWMGDQRDIPVRAQTAPQHLRRGCLHHSCVALSMQAIVGHCKRVPARSTSALLAAVLLPGCALLQLPSRGAVGDEGAAGVYISGVAQHRKIQTFSVLPGADSTEVPTEKARCAADGVHVRVWSAVHDAEPSLLVCNAAAGAASASIKAAGMGGTRVDYRITLVSDGGGMWRHRGAARGGIPSLAFWLPVQGTLGDRELARTVRNTAHEFHHLGWALNGSPRRVWADEAAAYAAGACTQLAVLGRLRQEWLPPAHDWLDDALPDTAVMRSSRAGADLHVRLLPFFAGAEEIQRNSPSGRTVMAWCENTRPFR